MVWSSVAWDPTDVCWNLRRLGKGGELRPIFLRVVTDCVTQVASGS